MRANHKLEGIFVCHTGIDQGKRYMSIKPEHFVYSYSKRRFVRCGIKGMYIAY